MFKWKRFLLPGSLGLTLLAGLLFTSATSGFPTAFANCNSTATGNWSNNCQVSEGNISNMVYAIQQSIDDSHLCAQIAEDGDFGQLTFNAVKCFQKAKGFPPNEQDGIVGPMTWGAMYNMLVRVRDDGTFTYYKGASHASLSFDFAKNDSTAVWWVWVTSDSEWCTMNLSPRC